MKHIQLLTIGLTLTTLTTPAADWPRWRGSNFDGITTESIRFETWGVDGPKQLWKAKVGTGWSSLSVADGRAYTMGNTEETDSVYALDATTGAELWKHSYPCSSKDPNGYPGTRSTPTVDDDRVYSVSRQGHLFCLDAKSGKVIWSKNFVTDFKSKIPTWGFAGSPLVEKEMLIVEAAAAGAAVVALNKRTGQVLWQNGNEGAGYGSPVPYTLENERGVVVFNPAGLTARRVSDGKLLWHFPWTTSYDVNAATPLVIGDKFFISSGYNTGCALIQLTNNKPKVLWTNKNMRNQFASCVYLKDYLYGFDDGELRCLDFKTGESKWSSGRYGKGSSILAGQTLLAFSDKGLLAAVEASPGGFKELASTQILGGKSTWIVPVLANGRIYARSLENLVCLDAGATKTAAVAPTLPEVLATK